MGEKLVGENASFKLNDTLITNAVLALDQLTTDYADKIKMRGNRALKQAKVKISAATRAGCVQTAPVFATIDGNSTKLKSQGDPVVLGNAESDMVTINGVYGQNTCSFNAKVQINNAGQEKVFAV